MGLAYLCWLLFARGRPCASIVCWRHCWACHLSQRFGPIGAIIVGLIASTISLIAGQIAFITLRSPFIRAGIVLLFVVPAAIAGYHAALGLPYIGISAEGWRQAMALIGAIVMGDTAWARMMLSASRPMPDKALPLP